MKKALQFDILKDSPLKILICICIPLSAVYFLSCITASFTNILYSKYAPDYFAVAGLISAVTVSLSMIMNGVISAAWIKTAFLYKAENLPRKNFFANALYSVLFTNLILIVLSMALKNTVFKIFCIPNEMYKAVSVYYTASFCGYIFTSVATFLINCINGVGSVFEIFIGNAINSCGTVFSAAILFCVFNAGIVGAALVIPVCSVFVIIYGIIILKRRGVPLKFEADNWKPDCRMIAGILKIGLLMGSQCLFCQIGDICIGLQTNKLLSINYISVLSVTIPLTTVFSSFSAAVNTFVPINYRSGNIARVKKFINTLIAVTLVYAVMCTVLYAALGKWYYSTLFDDPEAVALGAKYWKIYGLGVIPLALIFVLRYFFDCIGYNKTAFVTGIVQMGGALFGAYVLIPVFGNSGRSWSNVSAYLAAAVYLIILYFVLYRKIYYKNDSIAK